MAVRVIIPTVLRRHTGGQNILELEAHSLRELIDRLGETFPSLREQIMDEDKNSLRSFVSIFVNDEDVRFLKGMDTPLKDGDTVSLIPSIAGGCCGMNDFNDRS